MKSMSLRAQRSNLDQSEIPQSEMAAAPFGRLAMTAEALNRCVGLRAVVIASAAKQSRSIGIPPGKIARRLAGASQCIVALAFDDVRCHRLAMSENDLRPGEVAVELPARTDAGIYFIGAIHTPWKTRQECPKRGSPDGPICTIVVDERWREGLSRLAAHKRVQVLYWMHQARRDLVLQTPFRKETTGTFALRSPVRPNPIASSIVELVAINGTSLQVRGLDCLDGTRLVDLKPDNTAG